MTPAELLPFGARLEDHLLLFCAHPLQRSDPAVTARGFELVERPNAKLRVELGYSFWSDPLELQQVEDRWRELLEELAMVGDVACVGELSNLRGEVFSNARNRP